MAITGSGSLEFAWIVPILVSRDQLLTQKPP